jgi:hypothetical protein
LLWNAEEEGREGGKGKKRKKGGRNSEEQWGNRERQGENVGWGIKEKGLKRVEGGGGWWKRKVIWNGIEKEKKEWGNGGKGKKIMRKVKKRGGKGSKGEKKVKKEEETGRIGKKWVE